MKLAPTVCFGLFAVLATAAACGSGTTPDCSDASACEVVLSESDSSTPTRDSGKETSSGDDTGTGNDTGNDTGTGTETGSEGGNDGGGKKDSGGSDAGKETGGKDAASGG